MVEEKNVAASPQAIPAMVAAPAAPAVVLSQAPPIAATDVKPAVDKATSVVAPTVVAQK